MMFTIGDVVRHGKGPSMTVSGVTFEHGGHLYVPCEWFTDDGGTLWRGAFVESQLTRAARDALPPSHPVADAMQKAFSDYHARRDAAMRAIPPRAPATPHPWFGPLGVRALAQELYEAYGQQAAWKNFLGREMPVWGELPDHIQESWTAVAQRAIDRVGGER